MKTKPQSPSALSAFTAVHPDVDAAAVARRNAVARSTPREVQAPVSWKKYAAAGVVGALLLGKRAMAEVSAGAQLHPADADGSFTPMTQAAWLASGRRAEAALVGAGILASPSAPGESFGPDSDLATVDKAMERWSKQLSSLVDMARAMGEAMQSPAPAGLDALLARFKAILRGIRGDYQRLSTLSREGGSRLSAGGQFTGSGLAFPTFTLRHGSQHGVQGLTLLQWADHIEKLEAMTRTQRPANLHSLRGLHHFAASVDAVHKSMDTLLQGLLWATVPNDGARPAASHKPASAPPPQRTILAALASATAWFTSGMLATLTAKRLFLGARRAPPQANVFRNPTPVRRPRPPRAPRPTDAAPTARTPAATRRAPAPTDAPKERLAVASTVRQGPLDPQSQRQAHLAELFTGLASLGQRRVLVTTGSKDPAPIAALRDALAVADKWTDVDSAVADALNNLEPQVKGKLRAGCDVMREQANTRAGGKLKEVLKGPAFTAIAQT